MVTNVKMLLETLPVRFMKVLLEASIWFWIWLFLIISNEKKNTLLHVVVVLPQYFHSSHMTWCHRMLNCAPLHAEHKVACLICAVSLQAAITSFSQWPGHALYACCTSKHTTRPLSTTWLRKIATSCVCSVNRSWVHLPFLIFLLWPKSTCIEWKRWKHYGPSNERSHGYNTIQIIVP